MDAAVGGRAMIVGLDLGGNDIKAGATDLTGGVLTTELLKVASHGHLTPADVVQQLRLANEAVLEATDRTITDLVLVSLCVPSPCNSEGELLSPPNLGSTNKAAWRNANLREMLSEALQKPVYCGNDGNAAARDEYDGRFGASKTHNLALFTTGTGVGGGIVHAGKVHLGRGQAAELGHELTPAHERLNPAAQCGCTGTNCIEAHASLSALKRRVGEELNNDRWKSVNDQELEKLRETYQKDPRAAAYMVRDLAEKGHALGKYLMEEWAIAFGLLAVNIAKHDHPDVIAIGGGLRECSDTFKDWFLSIVRETYKRFNAQECHDDVRIEWATHTDRGWRGVVLMSIDSGAINEALKAFPISD